MILRRLHAVHETGRRARVRLALDDGDGLRERPVGRGRRIPDRRRDPEVTSRPLKARTRLHLACVRI